MSAVEGRGVRDLRGRAEIEALGAGKDGGDQREEAGREEGARKGARKDWTEETRGMGRGSGSGLPA